jgi:hypothetical protein
VRQTAVDVLTRTIARCTPLDPTTFTLHLARDSIRARRPALAGQRHGTSMENGADDRDPTAVVMSVENLE